MQQQPSQFSDPAYSHAQAPLQWPLSALPLPLPSHRAAAVAAVTAAAAIAAAAVAAAGGRS